MHDTVHSNFFFYPNNSHLIFKNKDTYKIAKKKTNEQRFDTCTWLVQLQQTEN